MKQTFVLTMTDEDGTILKQLVSDDEMKLRAVMEQDYQSKLSELKDEFEGDEEDLNLEEKATKLVAEYNRYSSNISALGSPRYQWHLLQCEIL